MHYDSFDEFVDELVAAQLSASEVLDAVDERVSTAFPRLPATDGPPSPERCLPY